MSVITEKMIDKALRTNIKLDNVPKNTLRGLLTDLLRLVWEQNEGFSGKRPWGNSGWDDYIVDALSRKRIVPKGKNLERELVKQCILTMTKDKK